MNKILILLLFSLVQCNKKSDVKMDTAIHTELSNFENFDITFNNSYFIINLNTGKIQNYKEEEVGAININNKDKNDLKIFFYKYHIDSIKGENYVFDETKLTNINQDIIVIDKDGVNQSVLFIKTNSAIKNISKPANKNILLFYQEINKILKQYPDYNDLYRKRKNEDSSISL